ncbi:efflux RND transporter periplasmic adaptor subunit [Oceanimonas marisflavi]|uniref:efflux RND transporter periplasmic adaptor subunit n=1 Tax=Oceanimonas marisflavi TaxID=2059724 RepID=UPI000D319421|nr:efflux RND transporter periplasmic adaptor subunit [Oceanimonas marisflavi]
MKLATALMGPLLSGALMAPVLAQSELSLAQSELRAQLSPVRYATLAAGMTGKAEQVLVREGQRVEQGQILLEFDCTLQQAQRQKARAQLAGARNNYTGNKRMAELNAIGSVELNNSKIEIDKARADLAYLDATMARCRVPAPYAGFVGEVHVRGQEFVQAGEPLLEIIDDSALELEFIAPSRWLAWLTPGHEFEVAIEDTGRRYPARLAHTAGKVDPLSQSIKAVAVIDGQFDELLPGMSGRLLLLPPDISAHNE